ncbi:hypothetical protein EZS27_012623, partial [termite gut metagenome]
AVVSRCKQMHRVKRNETLNSISKDYNVSIEDLIVANPELESDGLKKENYICIPAIVEATDKKEEEVILPSIPNQTIKTTATGNIERGTTLPIHRNQGKGSTVKAAIILPFSEVESRTRMVEYYEGFLMAVDSLKRTGVSVDLYVYDSGGQNASILSILQQKEMVDMDVIFGPLYSKHIKPLANFAKANKIRLVIPFTSKDNEVFSNPYIYQINTPQSYLYAEVYTHFAHEFKGTNVVIWNTGEQQSDYEFTKGIRRLPNKPFTVRVLEKEDIAAGMIRDAFSSTQTNIVIPTSNSNAALVKLISQLLATFGKMREDDIRLFGYPDWQAYAKDHIDEYFEWDTYFYSSFYTDNLMPEVMNFTKNYRKWYSKDTANTYPKYGMLGYDTGFYFLKGLFTYGSELENNLSNVEFTPIQIGFKFSRANNEGGFINKQLFFVHFTKEHEIIKMNFD